MKLMSEKHLSIYRRHMVEVIDIHFDLAGDEIGKAALDPRVRAALMSVPRHHFVPAEMALLSYQDTPLPIGFQKTISQPFIGALMIDLLEPKGSDTVLEVGTGLGYQSAVLAELVSRVWSVEIVEEFAEAAKALLEEFAIPNVEVRVGDGSRGWAEHAPFDKILVTAASTRPPTALVEQLKPGGRMVIPLGASEAQQLSVVSKGADGAINTREVMPVRFTQLELG
jgi:protein-L-isoaspartate(D-aspartate) O-methyltransferase